MRVLVSALACRPGPGGRHCQKANVEHKACEGPPCPKGAPSFRDLQCLSYDRQASKKKGIMLTAIINDGETHRNACTPVAIMPKPIHKSLILSNTLHGCSIQLKRQQNKKRPKMHFKVV